MPALPSLESEPMPPRIIGQYRVRSLIGSGGIGSVYRATDVKSGETVALKLLSTGAALDAKSARRMAREFETLASLDHENVVRVFKTGVWHGYPYLTMELVEGVNLRQYLSVNTQESKVGARRRGVLDPLGLLRPSTVFDELASEEDAESMDGLDEDGDGLGEDEDESEEGPDALRRLADAIDEPLTDDEESDAISDSEDEEPEPSLDDMGSGDWSGSFPSAGKPSRTSRLESIRIDKLNDSVRLSRLKNALPQVCRALAYIHARGLVHRDLKPSNIMVDRSQRVRLMDFGLAKFLASDTEVTATGNIVGTYRYMAPEQLRGERTDGRTDLFSLGVMLYEVLAGKPPFDGASTIEVCKKILETEPVPLELANPGVDLQLARIVHWLIAKDMEDRPQTAEEVLDMIPKE